LTAKLKYLILDAERRRVMLEKLEKAMNTWRIRTIRSLTADEYRLARMVDIELLAVLERMVREMNRR
jgi:hypothetical protein